MWTSPNWVSLQAQADRLQPFDCCPGGILEESPREGAAARDARLLELENQLDRNQNRHLTHRRLVGHAARGRVRCSAFAGDDRTQELVDRHALSRCKCLELRQLDTCQPQL